ATIWAVYYENIFYFSPAALGRTFAAAAIDAEVRPCYIDGQYLAAETSTGDVPHTHTINPEFVSSVRALRDAFASATRSWRDRLRHQDLSRTVVWGAAGR